MMRNFNNLQVTRLPAHLKQFIVELHYERYTPIDQAVWRYVMRQNYNHLKDIAYYPYIPGLEKAGLSIEKIPDLQEMNNALGRLGWGAVTVDGFIPPAAFMEFQAYRVLVIAADIRQLAHIEYTPAPDIIHESAGHAPIIADKDYQRYLSYFGSIGSKAIYSHQDFELYEAIRELSILKEQLNTPLAALRKAEKRVKWCTENLGESSEMALLSRLHWWTVEYGLIGSLEDPKIYGAGLLSSIEESANCMQPEVEKLPYTLEAVQYPYDITRPQPQLFVTPNFQNLLDVLEAFADTMAFRIGGASGIMQAIHCKNTCTAVLSSGLQISGVFTDVGLTPENEIYLIKTSGATALAIDGKQMAGHNTDHHRDGFSSPLGKLKKHPVPLETCSREDLRKLGIIELAHAALDFESGILVSGTVKRLVYQEQKLVLISFDRCLVKDSSGKTIFEPTHGTYDMAIGEKIVSVFCGAADQDNFMSQPEKHQSSDNYKPVITDERNQQLNQLYQQVRDYRNRQNEAIDFQKIYTTLQKNFGDDWLCQLEILEILQQEQLLADLADDILINLKIKAAHEPSLRKLVNDGLYLIEYPTN